MWWWMLAMIVALGIFWFVFKDKPWSWWGWWV